MKTRKILLIVFGIISLAILAVIIVESATESDLSSSHSLGFTKMVIDIINTIAPNTPLTQDQEKLHNIVRKLFGHFLLFGGFGLFTTLTYLMLDDAMKNKKIQILLLSISTGLSVAVISECIQLFTPGRAGMVSDVFIDFSGYLLFTILIYLIFYLIYLKQNNNQKG